ncbi:acetyltransferase [Xylariaceae sp. FL1651]|nr:acetyltransferase [Xylariaceae sp. FL1651]
MGTPFISLLEPTRLEGYDRKLPHDQQPSHIPGIFQDAMSVREAVFVREQGVPLDCEYDADDARSCHWVMYASVNMTTAPEERDPATDAVLRPRRSETRSMPIGTMRIVPFPHPPHPPEGARYVGNVLQPAEDGGGGGDGSNNQDSHGKNHDNSQTGSNISSTAAAVADDPAGGRPRSQPLSTVDERRQTSAMPFGADRATDFHDGKEPYVKLGRVAVVPEFRGHRISAQLWNAARKWLQENPTYFNPSVKELGMDRMKAGTTDDIPKWNGLVCTHAQEDVVKVYERWGFRVDKGMGKWFEEGIPHVGMYLRLELKSTDPKV